MSAQGSVGNTRQMTPDELKGNPNYDYTFPSVVQGAGKVRGVDDPSTARGVKKPLVIQDITADSHDNAGWNPDNAGNPHPFQVREG